MLERNDEGEDETESIFLVIEGKKDETFFWDKGYKVTKILPGKKESDEKNEFYKVRIEVS